MISVEIGSDEPHEYASGISAGDVILNVHGKRSGAVAALVDGPEADDIETVAGEDVQRFCAEAVDDVVEAPRGGDVGAQFVDHEAAKVLVWVREPVITVRGKGQRRQIEGVGRRVYFPVPHRGGKDGAGDSGQRGAVGWQSVFRQR